MTIGWLVEYALDNYGTCARGPDCYHGRNERGVLNGCLNAEVGWRGRACPHWRPIGGPELDELLCAWRSDDGAAGPHRCGEKSERAAARAAGCGVIS